MKRKWSVIMMVLLAVVTLMTVAVPALAQSEDEFTAESRPKIRDGLAIIVPLAAPVGKPVTMMVLQRSDAGPVEGAGVWALTRDEAIALNERISAMRESGEITSADIDWDSLVEVHGFFLGRTNSRGKLEYAFDEAGRYVLLAVKRGYVPGRTSIGIKDLPNALGLRAPKRVPVGEPVLVTAFQRGTEEPVAGAGIWALTREEAELLKEEMAAMRESTETVLEEIDWESLIEVRGIFLGSTDERGNLEHTFFESGGRLLVAVKRGYLPASQGIFIGGLPHILAMEVQRWAKVGETVPMTVFERGSGEPTDGAGVWALTREDAAALREEMAAMRESGETSLADVDWESKVNIHGIFLGKTNERGKLEHAFSEPGGYILVSVKRGYVPGTALIIVRALRPEIAQPERVQLQRYVTPIQPEPYSAGQPPAGESTEPLDEDNDVSETD